MSEARKTGRVLIGLWAAAGLLVAGAAGGWFWAAGQTQAAVRAAVTQAGPGAALKGLSVTGFPFRLTHDATGVVLPAPGGWRVEAARVVATTLPLETNHWVVEDVEDLVLIDPDGGRHAVELTQPQASVSWSGRGLRRLAVIAQAVRIAGPDGAVRLGAGAVSVQAVADDKSPADLAVSLEASGLTGAPATTVILRGMLIGGQTLAGKGLSAWQAGGGAFDVRYGLLAQGAAVADDLTGRLAGPPPWSLAGKTASATFDGAALTLSPAPSR